MVKDTKLRVNICRESYLEMIALFVATEDIELSQNGSGTGEREVVSYLLEKETDRHIK